MVTIRKRKEYKQFLLLSECKMTREEAIRTANLQEFEELVCFNGFWCIFRKRQQMSKKVIVGLIPKAGGTNPMIYLVTRERKNGYDATIIRQMYKRAGEKFFRPAKNSIFLPQDCVEDIVRALTVGLKIPLPILKEIEPEYLDFNEINKLRKQQGKPIINFD